MGFRRLGFEKGNAYFFKQMGKGMLCTYALFGAAWFWNETSPLGWWTLKPRPKVWPVVTFSLFLGWGRHELLRPFVLLQDMCLLQ